MAYIPQAKTRGGRVSRILRRAACQLRTDAQELAALLGGDSPLLIRQAAKLRAEANGAEHLADAMAAIRRASAAAALLLVLAFGKHASASEFTFIAEDARTGEQIEILDPRYQCSANKAADAAERCAIDIAYSAIYSFGFFQAAQGLK